MRRYSASLRMMWSWKRGCQAKSARIFRISNEQRPLYHRMMREIFSLTMGFLLPAKPPVFGCCGAGALGGSLGGRDAINRVSTYVTGYVTGLVFIPPHPVYPISISRGYGWA